MMKYKGYIGHVEYDGDARIFHGDIVNINDVVTFQGRQVDELEQAFKDSIDDYLDWCKKLGQSPDKPFSGQFMVRTTPETHQAAHIAAKISGLSLNAWVDKAIRDAAKST